MEEEGSPPPQSPSSSSSSDDDSEMETTATAAAAAAAVELDEETKAEVERLEAAISESPYYYDYHVSLIKCLRQSTEREKLGIARERMSKVFPLTEELWLQWIADEQMNDDDDDDSFIESLYEKAVRDYMSARIWLNYCKFVMQRMKEGQCTIDGVRKIFERAITAVGLHVRRGGDVWDAYREFESIVLESVKQVSHGDDVDSQVQRVANLYKRQLSVPLAGMESTMMEFQSWAKENSLSSDVENYTRGYQRALEAYNKCRVFEETLTGEGSSHLNEYKAYIEHEIKGGDPARVQCIYERCLASNCLLPEMWAAYTEYVEQNLKIKDIVLKCHEKSVRNCPWVALLWQNYMSALEQYDGNNKEKIEKVLEDSLLCAGASDPLGLWTSYLDALWRRVRDSSPDDAQAIIRNAYKRAIDFCSEVDSTSSLKRTLASIEAKLGNLTEVVQLWEEVMSEGGHRKEAEMWIEYVSTVRRCGDVATPEKIRKLLREGVVRSSDNPSRICDALLAFERIEGSINNWKESKEKCRKKMKEMEERETKRKEKEERNRKGTKRKKDGAENESNIEERNENKKRKPMKFVKEGEEDESEALKDDVTTAPNTASATTQMSRRRDFDPDRTAFVSNLLFDVTEDELKAHFNDCDINEIHIVRDFKFKLKNYAYVEFSKSDDVKKALQLDRKDLKGKSVFVSEYGKSKKNVATKPRYPDRLSETTVFVSNLKFTSTRDEIKELFEKHGSVKEVRKTLDGKGRPRGFAYVKFEEAASARAAIRNLDNLLFKGRPLCVALSNPPSKGAGGQVAAERKAWAAVAAPEADASRRKRPHLSLVPRTVQRKGPPAPEATTTTGKKMSNADFRKFIS